MAKMTDKELWDNLGNKSFVEKFVKEAKDITPKIPRVSKFTYSKRDFKDFMTELLNQVSLFRAMAAQHRKLMVDSAAEDTTEGYAKAASNRKAAEAYDFMCSSIEQMITNRFEPYKTEIELIDDTV